MTRHDAKEKVQEWWGETGRLTRWTIVLGLIGLVWTGVTAARNEVDDRYVLRREWNRQRDSLASAAELHALRDSARQETANRRLSFLICRSDGNSSRACAHLR